MFMSLFTNTLLCLSLSSLIFKPNLRFKLDLSSKQININKLVQDVYEYLGLLITLFFY